jgi:hypothetical protein
MESGAMHRLLLPSLAFGLLLALSLGFKAWGSIGESASAPDRGRAEVAAFLEQRGFSVSPQDPADTLWISASSGNCRVQVADVSPQGWQRAAATERAAGQRLSYVYAGKTYSEQPVLLTTLDSYWQRIKRYLHLPSSAYPVRAVIVSPACPAKMLNSDEFSPLS